MIKTLRITSIIAATAATVLLALPAFYGVRNDPEIEEFLKSPGIVEKYTSIKDQRPNKRDTDSPLVAAASQYKKLIDPPPAPAQPKVTSGTAAQQASTAPAPQITTAKFDLVATSYFSSKPEKSFALIDEAGKGLHWVKQGSTVGHVIIDKVKDGAIVLKEGQRTSEMTVKTQELWRKLVKNPPPSTRQLSTSQTSENSVQSTAVNSQQIEQQIPSASIPGRPSSPPIPSRRGQRFPANTSSGERITSQTPSVPPPNAIPAALQDATPESPVAPVVEITPQEKEIMAKIEKLNAEMESSKDSEEITAKMIELTKLLEQSDSTNSQDVNN